MEGRSRTRRMVIAGIAVAFIVGAATLAIAMERGDDQPSRVTLPPAVDGIVAIPGFPLRTLPATTTTADGSLFVFGGSLPRSPQFRNDGVLIRSDFASATHLPRAPFEPPLYSPAAVAVDGQIVVVGVACAEDLRRADGLEPFCGASLNAAGVLDRRDGGMEWRMVDLPKPLRQLNTDGPPRALGPTTAGRAVYEFGPVRHKTLWSFDPGTDSWIEIEGPGVRNDAACMSGDTLVVQSASYNNLGIIVEDDPRATTGSGVGGGGDGFVEPTIASRDLTGSSSWVHSPPGEGVTFRSGNPALACAGDDAFLHDSVFVDINLLYSIGARSWSNVAPAPLQDHFWDHVWTGSELVFIGPATVYDAPAPAIAYRPSSGSWRTLSDFPQVDRGASWNGKDIVGYVATRDEPTGIPGGAIRYPLSTE